MEEALVQRLVRDREVLGIGTGGAPLEAHLVAVLARDVEHVLRAVHTKHLVDHTRAPALRDGLLKPLLRDGRPYVVDLHLVGLGARHDVVLMVEDSGISGRVDGRRAILDRDELLVLDGIQLKLHLGHKTHERAVLCVCSLGWARRRAASTGARVRPEHGIGPSSQQRRNLEARLAVDHTARGRSELSERRAASVRARGV
eukprot:scaffold4613_cov129-Isochrysis_galbana.AAC.30